MLQIAEHSFWSLNSLIVQPCYTACREVLRHLVGGRMSPAMYAGSAVVSALLLCAIAVLVVMLAWPGSYLTSDITILRSPKRLAIAALANSVVLVGAYVAVAALIWGVADAAKANGAQRGRPARIQGAFCEQRSARRVDAPSRLPRRLRRHGALRGGACQSFLLRAAR